MNYRNDSIDFLYETITSISSVDECAALFEDLCTIKEIQDMAQRLSAAIMLHQGQNYQQISTQVGVSSATISRVSRCLNYGSGGYKKVMDDLDKKEKGND